VIALEGSGKMEPARVLVQALEARGVARAALLEVLAALVDLG
jgi:hypothetical protein